jgi:hypothetical protein
MKSSIGIVVVIIVILAAFSFVAGIRVPSPQRQIIAQCNTNDQQFRMIVEHASPYALVMGIPDSAKGNSVFRGDVTFSQTTGTVVRVPIGSDKLVLCNWLHSTSNISAYILPWSTNEFVERFSGHLAQGQTYDVRVTFSNMPPEGSTLWFTSIKQLRVIPRCSTKNPDSR